MWKKYLIIPIFLIISPVIGGKRKQNDSTDCSRTNKQAFRYCKKSCSSDSDCESNHKCLCDGDCGLSCVRNRIMCKDPGEITFGNRGVEGLQAGQYIQYWCFDTYNLSGSVRIKCLETGEWSAPKPKCELAVPQCDPPVIPDSAVAYYPRKMRKRFKYSDRVLLKCKEDGYFKSKGGVLSCKGTNQWTGDITCSPKSCGRPSDFPNGKIIGYLYSFKGKVRYVCNEGYNLNGPANRICQANEEWGGSKPTCEVVDCGPLDKPDHGDIIEQVALTFGNRIVFECKGKDYEMKGSRVRTCQSDGTWSGSPTTCEIVQCDDPGKPANGAQIVNKGFVYGGSVTFTCNKDYTLRGTSHIFCKENKKWTASVPQCLEDRLLQGSSKAKCNNGQWDAALPTCRDCDTAFPLGMGSRKIPDESIRASSQKDQHPAHHGRLGEDRYWCSKEEKTSYIQINLPKTYKITGARIQLKSKYDIKDILLRGQFFNQWMTMHYEKPPYNIGVEEITPEPFIAQSLRIRVLKNRKESICLRAEVYGCEIPRGCILQGSAVLIKKEGGYRKGYIVGIFYGWLEVLQSGESASTTMKTADVIIDEKPNLHELTKGTVVLGEDINSPDIIREGKIEQVADSFCTIKTNDETWKSNLNDVRIVEEPYFCAS